MAAPLLTDESYGCVGRSGPFATASFELDYRDAKGSPVALENYVRILR
jgi:hypothetical protein